MEKTKVFLSDSQVLFREGIHFVLAGEEEFEVTGETAGNEEALPLLETNPPHIAILGMADARLDGAGATRRIRRNLPSTAVVLTMDKSDTGKLLAAIRSGASACLPREAGPEQLLDMVRTVSRGGLPAVDDLLLPKLASLVLDEFEGLALLNEEIDNLLAGLSRKEKDILSGIAAGEPAERIAVRLEINQETLHRSLKVVLAKLVTNDQVCTVLEAARKMRPAAGVRPPIKETGEAGRVEYVTRAEFKDFQETLLEELKPFIGEQSPRTG